MISPTLSWSWASSRMLCQVLIDLLVKLITTGFSSTSRTIRRASSTFQYKPASTLRKFDKFLSHAMVLSLLGCDHLRILGSECLDKFFQFLLLDHLIHKLAGYLCQCSP